MTNNLLLNIIVLILMVSCGERGVQVLESDFDQSQKIISLKASELKNQTYVLAEASGADSSWVLQSIGRISDIENDTSKLTTSFITLAKEYQSYLDDASTNDNVDQKSESFQKIIELKKGLIDELIVMTDAMADIELSYIDEYKKIASDIRGKRLANIERSPESIKLQLLRNTKILVELRTSIANLAKSFNERLGYLYNQYGLVNYPRQGLELLSLNHSFNQSTERVQERSLSFFSQEQSQLLELPGIMSEQAYYIKEMPMTNKIFDAISNHYNGLNQTTLGSNLNIIFITTSSCQSIKGSIYEIEHLAQLQRSFGAGGVNLTWGYLDEGSNFETPIVHSPLRLSKLINEREVAKDDKSFDQLNERIKRLNFSGQEVVLIPIVCGTNSLDTSSLTSINSLNVKVYPVIILD